MIVNISNEYRFLMFCLLNIDIYYLYVCYFIDPVRSILFSPDGQYLLVAAGRHIRIFHNVPGFRNIILGLEEAKKNANNTSMKDRLQTQIDEAK